MRSLKIFAARAGAALGLGAVLFVVALALEGPRSAIARFGMSAMLATHGMYIARGDIDVKTDRLIADDLEIADDHGRVFFARRIVIAYDWRAAFGRSDRRYGLRSVDIDHPALRVFVLPNGSTNLSLFVAAGQPTAHGISTAPAEIPFDCTVRVSGGRLDVENPSSYATPGRSFAISAIEVAGASHDGRASGTLSARYRTDASDAAIRGALSENDAVGFAQATLVAAGADIAPLLDAFVSSSAFEIDAGVADATLQAYDVGYTAATGPVWRFAGRGSVRGGRLRFDPLAVPIQDIAGPLTYQAGYLAMPALRGSVAGLPVSAHGSIRLFPGVRFALQAVTAGDLHAARTIFSFGRDLDVAGPISVQLRVDGPLDRIHAGGVVDARGTASYDRAPFGAARAAFYYHDGHVALPAVQASYDGGSVDARGDVDLTRSDNPAVEAIATAQLPARLVPVAVNLNRDGDVQARMLITGPLNVAQYDAFARTRGGNGASVAIDIAGQFGMRTVSAATSAWRGGDITVRTAYDHADPANRALFASVIASRAPLTLLAGAARLPGITGAIALPDVSAAIDGVAVLHGTSDGAVRTAAALSAHNARVAGADLGDIELRARGLGPRIDIDGLTVAGRDVRASARGAARIDPNSLTYAIALSGGASADLSRASVIPGGATGRIDGDFEAALNSGGWAATIVTRGGGASVAGMPVRDAVLTAVAGNGVPLRFGARANMLGGTAAALGTFAIGRDAHDTVPAASMWATGIDAATLAHVANVPLDAGTAVVIGHVEPASSGGTYSGAVSLAHGRIDRVPIAGDADVTYRAGQLRARARLDVAGTRANVNADARGVAPGQSLANATIDARATVRDGDAGGVLKPFLPATVPVTGSFDAALTAHGPARAPDVGGSLHSGAMTIRGVTFLGSEGGFAYKGDTLTLRDGRTQLGTTRVAFGGSYGPRELQVQASTPHMDLSDVNDFFAGRDVFDGTGSGSLAASFAPASTSARGSVTIADAAVGGVPLGSVDATFYGIGKALHADVTQGGELGRSRVGVDVALGTHSRALPDPRLFSYDINGQLSDVDLGLVTRFAGLEDLGVRGQIQANGRAHASPGRVTADVGFSVHDAYVRKLPLQTASGVIHADGTRLNVSDILVKAPFGSATGSLAFARSGALSGDAQVALDDLAGLATFAGLPGRFTGSAGGTLAFAGTMRNPEYVAALHAGAGSALGIAYDDLSLHATYSRNDLSIGDSVMRLAGGNGTLSLSGSLPLELSPLALGPANKPVRLALTAQHVRMRAFDPLVSGLGTIDGTLDATVAANGLAGKPELGGTATLRDGAATSKFQTVPLRNANATLALAHDRLTLSSLSGAVGDGSFSGSGVITVVPAVGLRTNAGVSYYASLHAHAIPLAVPDWVSGTLNGDMSLTQSGFTPYLAGTASLSSGTIPFSAIYGFATTLGQTVGPSQAGKNVPGVPALRPGHIIAYGGEIFPPGPHLLTQADLATPPPTIFDLPALNLGLVTKVEDMRVRGGPVDITAGGTLDVNGSVRDPQLDGVFDSKRGQINLLGLTFRVTRGQLVFDPDGGVLPSLDATAVTDVQGDQITLAVSGRIDRLNTNLSSSQGKTSEQILSTLVTGTDVGALTGGVTQGTLASSASKYLSSQLTTSLLNPFSNALAQTLNIEQVALRFDANGDLVIDVRKYVSPTVAVLYTSTVSAPVTQGYGIAYNIRDYAALEFGSTIAPSGFTSFLLNMRFTFK